MTSVKLFLNFSSYYLLIFLEHIVMLHIGSFAGRFTHDLEKVYTELFHRVWYGQLDYVSQGKIPRTLDSKLIMNYQRNIFSWSAKLTL